VDVVRWGAWAVGSGGSSGSGPMGDVAGSAVGTNLPRGANALLPRDPSSPVLGTKDSRNEVQLLYTHFSKAYTEDKAQRCDSESEADGFTELSRFQYADCARKVEECARITTQGKTGHTRVLHGHDLWVATISGAGESWGAV
jgi:hypothetical protein